MCREEWISQRSKIEVRNRAVLPPSSAVYPGCLLVTDMGLDLAVLLHGANSVLRRAPAVKLLDIPLKLWCSYSAVFGEGCVYSLHNVVDDCLNLVSDIDGAWASRNLVQRSEPPPSLQENRTWMGAAVQAPHWSVAARGSVGAAGGGSDLVRRCLADALSKIALWHRATSIPKPSPLHLVLSPVQPSEDSAVR